jgi:hypothetical protein
MSLDFQSVWNSQGLPQTLTSTLAIAAKFVNDNIVNPPSGISNISEWCKKDMCWTRIQNRIAELEAKLPAEFLNGLLSRDEEKIEVKSAKRVQKIDDGIKAQEQVFALSSDDWSRIFAEGSAKNLFSPKERSILEVASKIPARIPSEKQCMILLDLLERCRAEGIS